MSQESDDVKHLLAAAASVTANVAAAPPTTVWQVIPADARITLVPVAVTQKNVTY